MQIFDKEGKLLSVVRKLGDPVSIAVDAQENLYVLDDATKNISTYSAQGGLIGNLVKEKEGTPGRLLKPVAIMMVLFPVQLNGTQTAVIDNVPHRSRRVIDKNTNGCDKRRQAFDNFLGLKR